MARRIIEPAATENIEDPNPPAARKASSCSNDCDIAAAKEDTATNPIPIV